MNKLGPKAAAAAKKYYNEHIPYFRKYYQENKVQMCRRSRKFNRQAKIKKEAAAAAAAHTAALMDLIKKI